MRKDMRLTRVAFYVPYFLFGAEKHNTLDKWIIISEGF